MPFPVDNLEWNDITSKMVVRATFLENVSVSGTGAWKDVRGLFPFTITVEDAGIPGTAGYVALDGSFTVAVSCAPKKPDDRQNGIPLGDPVVIPGDNPPQAVRVEAPARWVKVIPTINAGVANAYGFGG